MGWNNIINKITPCSKKNLQIEISRLYEKIEMLQRDNSGQTRIMEEHFTQTLRELQRQWEFLATYRESFENLCKQIEGLDDVKKIPQETRGILSKINQIEDAMTRSYPLSVLRFEVHIVEHCNLNCQSCDHFSPLAEEEYIDVDKFERDFKRLSELTEKHAGRIFLLGGEPLLHPRLITLLRIARECFPLQETRIAIVTNGLLLPSMNTDFWENCKKYNIELDVTKYPINLDLNGVEVLAAEKKVRFRYFGNSKVVKTSWHLPLDEMGMQNPAKNFVRCWRANNCIFLADGKLYPCVIPPNVRHFNKYFNKNIPVTEHDYVDIYKINNISEAFNFLCKPISFCRYCNVCGETKNHPWGVSERDIKEWT